MVNDDGSMTTRKTKKRMMCAVRANDSLVTQFYPGLVIGSTVPLSNRLYVSWIVVCEVLYIRLTLMTGTEQATEDRRNKKVLRLFFSLH
jgi:hypothetical protein